MRFGANAFTFGTQQFGSGTDRDLTWALEIDWDGDGAFDGQNDAAHLFSVEVERGRQFFLANQGGGFEPVAAGRMTARIVDQERKYDPYNSASPLNGLVIPGRAFRLRVKRESDGVVLDVIAGEIDDIKPDYGASVRTVTISGIDSLRRLQNIRISSAVQVTIQYDSAIAQCLWCVRPLVPPPSLPPSLPPAPCPARGVCLCGWMPSLYIWHGHGRGGRGPYMRPESQPDMWHGPPPPPCAN